MLEDVVLDLLKTRLMQFEAVAAFVKDFAHLRNLQRAEHAQEGLRLDTERKALKRKLEGLYAAVAEGLRSPELKEKLLDLVARVGAIEEALERPAPGIGDRTGLSCDCRAWAGGRPGPDRAGFCDLGGRSGGFSLGRGADGFDWPGAKRKKPRGGGAFGYRCEFGEDGCGGRI